MKFTTEERALLISALSIAMDNATTPLKWRYHSLRAKIERANRSHLTLVERKPDPPDVA